MDLTSPPARIAAPLGLSLSGAHPRDRRRRQSRVSSGAPTSRRSSCRGSRDGAGTCRRGSTRTCSSCASATEARPRSSSRSSTASCIRRTTTRRRGRATSTGRAAPSSSSAGASGIRDTTLPGLSGDRRVRRRKGHRRPGFAGRPAIGRRRRAGAARVGLRRGGRGPLARAPRGAPEDADGRDPRDGRPRLLPPRRRLDQAHFRRGFLEFEGWRKAGGLDAHPAARQEPLPLAGAHAEAQGDRGGPGR